jgi:hypothetical protein
MRLINAESTIHSLLDMDLLRQLMIGDVTSIVAVSGLSTEWIRASFWRGGHHRMQ